jgi:predicted RNA-binding Zn-ribbon protein involved in translation (DUF1610 family)
MSFFSKLFGEKDGGEKLKEYKTFSTGISFKVSAIAFECHECGAQFIMYDNRGDEGWENSTRENGGAPHFCPYCGK